MKAKRAIPIQKEKVLKIVSLIKTELIQNHHVSPTVADNIIEKYGVKEKVKYNMDYYMNISYVEYAKFLYSKWI